VAFGKNEFNCPVYVMNLAKVPHDT